MILKRSTPKFFRLVPILSVGFLLLSGVLIQAQTPSISDLVLTPESPGVLTDDRLTGTYTPNGSVVETASVWYRAGRPMMDLYLPFEGGATNALLDHSGSDNHITASAVPTEVPVWNATGGYNGAGAFDFDGDDYFLAGDIFPMNSDYTKTAWVRMMGTGFRNIMGSRFNGDGDHHLKINPDSTLNAGHSFGAEVVHDPVKLNGDQWYFVAVTFIYETGEMILYKDGVEVSWGIVPEAFRSLTSSEVQIGARTDMWGWIGSIDEPRIYDRALSPEQIYAMYTEGNDVMLPQETADGERWRLYVTPFSATEIGTRRGSFALTVQGPEISDLALSATSPGNHTLDDLLVTQTDGAAVVGSATTWYRNGSPESLLYLPFEAGTHSALLDLSGNDNHAYRTADRLEHPSWNEAGGINGTGAFDFDGDQYLLAGDILPLDAPYTKTAWINLAGTDFRNIMSSTLLGDANHTFKVNPDGTLNAGHSFGSSVVQDPAALTLGQWYFVAVTYDFTSGQMILYKDGAEVDRGTVPVAFRSVADPSVLIGALDNRFEFEGNIDEARLYDRVLSPEQIASLFANGNTMMAAEETAGMDEWYVEVTPFALTELGSTTTSNTLTVVSILVSDIPGETIAEGASFATFDLDPYVTDQDYSDSEITWTFSGNSELGVSIDAVTHVATITVPNADWFGSEDITFTATNPATGSAESTATFEVTNVNDAPVIADIGAQSTNEDTDLTGLAVTFTDADPIDTHTITVVSANSNVTVSSISGNTSGSTYSLLPAANWSGTAQITVTVEDNGTGTLTDTEVYILTVDPVNDAPVIANIGNQSTDEDVTLTGRTVIFTDVEGSDTHTIEVVSGNANVSVANLSGNTSGSTYDLVPAADWNGSAQITVTVTDNGSPNMEDSETYTLTVSPINDAPVITPVGNQFTFEDQSLTGVTVDFVDPDAGDTHTISVVSLEANVSVQNLSGNTSGSTYDLVPAANWIGTAQITVTVTETGVGGLSDTEIYAFEVGAINDPPVLTDIGNQMVDEDNSLTGLEVVFSDLDIGDEHTITVVSSEAGVTIANLIGNTSGSTYDLVPAADWNGSAQITVTVTDDGTGFLTDTEVYTFTVNPINDAPSAINLPNNNVDENVPVGTLVGVLNSTDPDAADNHSYMFVFEGGEEEVDNHFFTVDGDEVKTAVAMDYELKESFNLLIQSDDGNGGTLTQVVPVMINNILETSIGDQNEGLAFNVYPVPAIDRITVEVENPDNSELLMEIYSNTGVLVHSEHTVHGTTVDLSDFSKGMYILRIQGERVFETRKIIVGD